MYVCVCVCVWVSICVCKDDSLLFLISLQKEMNEGRQNWEPGKRENLKERENEAKDTAIRSLSAKFSRLSPPFTPPLADFPPPQAKLAAAAARH